MLQVQDIFKNDKIRAQLEEYSLWLAEKYTTTLEGKYRIKYNSLYTLLQKPLSKKKQVEFFDCFMNSLDINPIKNYNSKTHKISFNIKDI